MSIDNLNISALVMDAYCTCPEQPHQSLAFRWDDIPSECVLCIVPCLSHLSLPHLCPQSSSGSLVPQTPLWLHQVGKLSFPAPCSQP